MIDEAHKATDLKLAKLERKIRTEYSRAAKELEEKFLAKMERYQARLAAATSDEARKKIAQNMLIYSTQAQKNINDLANAALNADKIAHSYIKGDMADIYALNYNFELRETMSLTGVDLSYGLIDAATVEELVTQNKNLLPDVGVDIPKELRWNKQHIQSEILQGILQGEGIPAIAKRMRNVTDMDYRAAIRNARTAVTSAENSGRQQAISTLNDDAQEYGITVRKEWIATFDDRTRMTHIELDGQVVDADKPFKVQGMKIRYPGDPTAAPELVYNCRCTMAQKLDFIDDADPNKQGKAYEAWKEAAKAKNQVVAEKKQLKTEAAEVAKYKEALDKFEIKSYNGIWKNDVTTDQYPELKDKIPAKKAYFDSKKAIEPDNPKWDEMLERLNDFETDGKKYLDIKTKYESHQKTLDELKAKYVKQNAPKQAKPATPTPKDNTYSQERKNAAYWFTEKNGGAKAADDVLRDKAGEVWRNATNAEKDAIYDYTGSYSKFNEPLRGYIYGTNEFVGVGNVDMEDIGVKYSGYAKGEIKKEIDSMTDLINKSSYDFDMWVQRGVDYKGMDKFLGIDISDLSGSQENLAAKLTDKLVTDYGFFSTASNKGAGFNGKPIIFNIYAPKGTKMMYIEPISKYGNGAGRYWDGVSKQSSFGSETEILLQRGTKFQIKKVEMSKGVWYMDLDVIKQ